MFKNLKRFVSKFFLGQSGSTSWGWTPPGQWSKKALLMQYQRYVYAIVSTIAEEAAKIEFEVMKKNAKGEEMEVINHPFYELMKKPNAETSQFQFLEMHFTFMKLLGESFWYLAKGQITGKAKEAYLLRPDLMEVVIDDKDPRGFVKGYVLTKLDGTKTTFEKEEILHFKMPNPLNPYRGLGTVEAAKIYIQTEEYASNWTKNSLHNAGRPSGVLNIKGTINPEQFEKIKRQFKEEYSGSENAGKTLLLKGSDGLDYQKLGMELGEVALKEMKDMTRDDIMVMFRVSKTMLGITDDVNRASALESKEVFYQNVTRPELDRFVDHLNAFLLPMLGGEGLIIKYQDPGFISDKDRLEEWTAGHNKWLTTNDIRWERGLDPIEGGDVLYQPMQMVPVREPDEEEDTDTDTGNDDGDEEEQPDEEEDTEEGKTIQKDAKRQERAEMFRKQLFDNQELWQYLFQKEVKKEFKLQLSEVLHNNKAMRVKKEFEDWLFNIKASKQRLMGILVPLGLEMMQDQAKFAFELADDPETKLELNERVQQYVNDRVEHLADSANDTTVEKIKSTILEGIQEGDSLAKLRKRVQEVYDEADKVRSELIARTETIAISNEAAQEAYRQSPAVTAIEWSTEAGACVYCSALNGKVVGIEENFVGTGEAVTGTDGSKFPVTYENVGHPPLHPNCRCALLPVHTRN